MLILSHSTLFFEELIWPKWEFLFLSSALIGISCSLTKSHIIKVDSFYVCITIFSFCLLLKLHIENADYYHIWSLLSFWLLYSFFYFYKFHKSHLYLTFTLVSVVLSLMGYYQFLSNDLFIVGEYDNPAGFSSTLVCLLPFIYKKWNNTSKLLNKHILGSAILFILIIILLSESRAAVISIWVMSI